MYDDPMAKILIVEDYPDLSESLKFYFVLQGHEVTCAPNGREALLHVLDQCPDVVLLDLSMPAMDGPTFLETLRLKLRQNALPVVVLTGLPDGPETDRVRNHGVNAVLLKGRATPVEILQALEAACGAQPS